MVLSVAQPAKALSAILVTVSGIETYCKDPQFMNAHSLISVTVLGISKYSRFAHSENSIYPMLNVQSGGMDISVSFLHPLNASSPMLSIPFGMLILSRLLHLRKAPSLITFTVSGKWIASMQLQSLNVKGSMTSTPLGISIVPCNPLHPLKALLPIFVTPSGILIFFRR